MENFPGLARRATSRHYLKDSLAEEHGYLADMHQKEGVSGPELMHLMRQQATNFGSRVVTDDIVEVDLSASGRSS